jgi:hypothetical protein
MIVRGPGQNLSANILTICFSESNGKSSNFTASCTTALIIYMFIGTVTARYLFIQYVHNQRVRERPTLGTKNAQHSLRVQSIGPCIMPVSVTVRPQFIVNGSYRGRKPFLSETRQVRPAAILLQPGQLLLHPTELANGNIPPWFQFHFVCAIVLQLPTNGNCYCTACIGWVKPRLRDTTRRRALTSEWMVASTVSSSSLSVYLR